MRFKRFLNLKFSTQKGKKGLKKWSFDGGSNLGSFSLNYLCNANRSFKVKNPVKMPSMLTALKLIQTAFHTYFLHFPTVQEKGAEEMK